MKVLTFVPVLVLAAAVPGDAVSDQTLRGYRAVTLQGFTLLLAPEIQAQPRTWDRLEWRLEDQLRETRAALPPHALLDLADVRIWVLHAGRNVGDPRAAFYLRRAAPGDASNRGDITVSQPDAFVERYAQQNIMLHELAHAFDDRRFRMKNPAVQAAFKDATRQGLYMRGEWDGYATTNAREYFAELSSAYFLTLSFPPLDRARLKRLDPVGYAAIEAAWSPPVTSGR